MKVSENVLLQLLVYYTAPEPRFEDVGFGQSSVIDVVIMTDPQQDWASPYPTYILAYPYPAWSNYIEGPLPLQNFLCQFINKRSRID